MLRYTRDTSEWLGTGGKTTVRVTVTLQYGPKTAKRLVLIRKTMSKRENEASPKSHTFGELVK